MTILIALMRAPVVPIIENHAAATERWSLNSVTYSSPERIGRRLPGFEVMFKAAPNGTKQWQLQTYVASKNLPFNITVVTGISGSYREADMLNFLLKFFCSHTALFCWQHLNT